MRFVGVCGGRNFGGTERERQILDETMRINVGASDVVVTGVAAGADRCARDWATQNNHDIVDVPALWKFGKSAGHRRNAVIAALPLRLLIAFPGGAGTASMVKMARAKEIEVLEVAP